MKYNVLFIVDGSIDNPILQSQGLPLLFNISSPSNKARVLSFEISNRSFETNKEVKSIISEFGTRINFHFVRINKKGVLPIWVRFVWNGLRTIRKINHEFAIQILHARSFFPSFLSILYKIFFNANAKVLYDNRGLVIDERVFSGEIIKNSKREKVLRWIEKKIIHKCDVMVVVSKVYKNYILKSYPEFLEKLDKKVVVIPNRTNLQVSVKTIEYEKEKMKDEIVCVYNGSSTSWQGTDKLYKIFIMIMDEIPSSSFKILTYHPEFFTENLPDNNLLKERLKILKVPSLEVKNELLRSSFGMLLREPSLVSQVSSPIKFAEYLAAGLPVLLLEGIGDTEEIIRKYGVGIIIRNNNFKDAIIEMKKLLNDQKIYEKCLYAAQKEFNIENSFEEYEKIYKNLLI